MRELKDKELAADVLKKEAQINKLYRATPEKSLNIFDNPTKNVGNTNLVMMHRAGEDEYSTLGH